MIGHLPNLLKVLSLISGTIKGRVGDSEEGKMAQRVWALASRPDNLSAIPGPTW